MQFELLCSLLAKQGKMMAYFMWSDRVYKVTDVWIVVWIQIHRYSGILVGKSVCRGKDQDTLGHLSRLYHFVLKNI